MKPPSGSKKTNPNKANFKPDGRQPHELARTKSLSYSAMNLNGFFHLARMGERLGIDLWYYESPDGRSIRGALDFLAPYADPKNKWSYKQIVPFEPAAIFSLLRRGSIAYDDSQYEAVIKKIPPEDIIADRTKLLWPYH